MLKSGEAYPGKLFIVEGIDGSGKSTQIELLHKWLLSQGYSTFFSEWNSSPLIKRTTRRGKNKRLLTPLTFSLIHATDFADSLRAASRRAAPLQNPLWKPDSLAAKGRESEMQARGAHVQEDFATAPNLCQRLPVRTCLQYAFSRSCSMAAMRPSLQWMQVG